MKFRKKIQKRKKKETKKKQKKRKKTNCLKNYHLSHIKQIYL